MSRSLQESCLGVSRSLFLESLGVSSSLVVLSRSLNDFEKFLVVVGVGWVEGVSVIITLALVLLRQDLRPVLENSQGQ